ncbi:MAG: hypothetical protein AAF664_04995 [Planctomycetota bacterium]
MKDEPQDSDRESVGSSTSIPEEIPDDIYLSSDPKSVEFTKANGTIKLILDYEASDFDEFVKANQDGMVGKGWAIIASSNLAMGTVTNFSKEDQKCTVSIGSPDAQMIKVAVILPGR